MARNTCHLPAQVPAAALPFSELPCSLLHCLHPKVFAGSQFGGDQGSTNGRTISKSMRKTLGMMEIGIQSGGHMMMRRHAFGPKLEQLVGVDLNPNTKSWEKFGSNVKVEIGNQGDPLFLDSLAAKCRDGIDVILVDGSHMPVHIIFTFAKLWPLVRPGGVYMIEDLHGPSPVWGWLYFGFNNSQINWPGIMGAESKKGPVNSIPSGNVSGNVSPSG